MKNVYHGKTLSSGFNVTVHDGQPNITPVEGQDIVISGQPLGLEFAGATREWMEPVKEVRATSTGVKLIGTLALARQLPAITRACMANRSQGRSAVNIATSVETSYRVLPINFLEKELDEAKKKVAYLSALVKAKASCGVTKGQFVVVELTAGGQQTLARNLEDLGDAAPDLG